MQDDGRPGLRRYGIPSSGALDQFSLHVANLLVGNPPGEPGIETASGGLCLEALGPVLVAVTGGDLSAEWNGRPAPLWTSFPMLRGDRLRFLHRRSGCRAYLSVRGGFRVDRYLGSASTFVRGGMGGNLECHDLLQIGEPQTRRRPVMRSLHPELRPLPASQYQVRVILSTHRDAFTPQGINTFLESSYRISARSDRQGFRTEGAPVATTRGADVISEPTPLGAIQIPGDGQPVILLRDGQTTGGYARIAAVIKSDLDQFGRMRPGDTVRFVSVSREDALESAAADRALLNLLAAALLD